MISVYLAAGLILIAYAIGVAHERSRQREREDLEELADDAIAELLESETDDGSVVKTKLGLRVVVKRDDRGSDS